MAGMDVKDSYYFCGIGTKSNESVTKGNRFQVGHCYGLATESTSLCVPNSDFIVHSGTTCKEFPVRRVCRITEKICFISEVDMIKVGNIVFHE